MFPSWTVLRIDAALPVWDGMDGASNGAVLRAFCKAGLQRRWRTPKSDETRGATMGKHAAAEGKGYREGTLRVCRGSKIMPRCGSARRTAQVPSGRRP